MWQLDAACAGADTDMFFPPSGHPNEGSKRALEYCASCPVVAECLQDALSVADRDDQGIRGGMVRSERQRLRYARLREEPVGPAPEPIPVGSPKPKACVYGECLAAPYQRGLCRLHWQKWRSAQKTERVQAARKEAA